MRDSSTDRRQLLAGRLPEAFSALALAVALVAALFAPPWPAGTVLLLTALLWFWLAPRAARDRLVAAGVLATAALALGGEARTDSTGSSRDEWLGEAERRYAAIWRQLDGRAAAVAASLPSELVARLGERDAGPEARREAFARLAPAELAVPAGAPADARYALTIVDADGEALAWAGSGLLNEPPAARIVRSGPQFRASATAVTLLVVRPLEDARRPIRLVAGLSLSTDRLPFEIAPGEAETPWSLVEADPDPATDPRGLSGVTALVRAPGLPVLVLTRTPPPPAAVVSHWAWLAAGLTLAFWVLARLTELSNSSAPRANVLASALVLAAAAFCLARASEVTLSAAFTLTLGAGLVVPTLRRAGIGADAGASPSAPLRIPLDAALGAGAAAALLALSRLLLEPRGVLDLGSDLPGSAEELTLRLALALVACGLFSLVARPRAATPAQSRRWGLIMAALLFVALALVDRELPSTLALLAAGAAVAMWSTALPRPATLSRIAAVFVVTALVAGIAWESSYRARMKEYLAEELLPRMAPLEDAEVVELQREVEQFLLELDLAAVTHRPLAGMDLRDLAFAVWKRSPLAHRYARSALALRGLDGPSLFSFGLPFRADAIGVPTGYEELLAPLEPALPGWPELAGEVSLKAAGREWGVARWWLRPRPGYRLRETAPAEQVLIDLLRGTPSAPGAPSGLPRSVLFALYPPNGGALISPWQERPPLPAALARAGQPAERGSAAVDTPSGPAWAFFSRRADGVAVLYLPRPTLVQSAERVGTIAASAVLLLAAITLVALVSTLPGVAVRDFVLRNLRSYSRRLLIVFAGLLLVPLLLLNLVLLRTVRASLERDQRSRGEGALSAAHRAVQEQVFSSGELGFAIHTALGAEFLGRIGRLVNHDVNVYHRAEHLSSSTSELFTAGLLPRRIPGDVFARLAFTGVGIAARTSQVQGTPFLELYTPVLDPAPADPGAPAGEPEQARIFLSVPLLAQQENSEQVLAALARRALVASTALIVLLAGIGGRLARGFTRPISQLVEGTRRIAAGAGRLELAPSELELAALVRAIDDMAGRIARGREELLREKEIVERVVDNITAGVISLDDRGRVLMHNRAAGDLLGVEVGRGLREPGPAGEGGAGSAERRELVAAFVDRAMAGFGTPGLGTAGFGPPQRDAPWRETLRWNDGDEGAREWSVVFVPLPGEGEPSALLVLEDLTEIFRGQRLAAWAEMARIIAHEIKNPLTPIRLSAEHMRLVHEREPERLAEVFDRCTRNILRQVDELQRIASEFSTYSRITAIELSEHDLRPALAALLEAYRAAPPPGIELRLDLPAEPVAARFDERLLGRALRNLLENAVRACGKAGVVEVHLAAQEGEAVLTVADTGPGVAPEHLSRIFEPYFSTHDTGTGLGLPISRRIVEEHGGVLVARNRTGGGLAVEIRIPLA